MKIRDQDEYKNKFTHVSKTSFYGVESEAPSSAYYHGDAKAIEEVKENEDSMLAGNITERME